MTDFDFLYGTWNVRHRRRRERLVGGAEWDEFDGVTICAPVLGGVGNFEQAWMPALGVIGAAFRLRDEATGTWSIHRASDQTGRLDPPVVGAFVDGVGTFVGTDTHDGATIDVRFVWDEITDRTARWTQSWAPAGTGNWEPNWVMEFVRVTAHAPAASRTDPGGQAVMTVFRSRLRTDAPLDRYDAQADEMLELARQQPGFVDFKSFRADDGERVSIATFATIFDQQAWATRPAHREAQRAGRDAYYEQYDLTTAAVIDRRVFDHTDS